MLRRPLRCVVSGSRGGRPLLSGGGPGVVGRGVGRGEGTEGDDLRKSLSDELKLLDFSFFVEPTRSSPLLRGQFTPESPFLCHG